MAGTKLRSAARALVLAAALAVAPHAAADAPRASVALLMDLSYSLRLRQGGVRRFDLLRSAVSALLEARGVEWALLSFRDLDDFRVDVPFTEERERVRAALPTLADGRLSPVREAVARAGEYVVEHARAPRRALVLVSDGIGTGSASFAAAVGRGFTDEGVALFVLGVEHADNPPIRESLEAVARATGGAYYTHGSVGELARALGRLPVGAAAGETAPARETRLAGIGVAAAPAAPGATLPLVDPWLLAAGAAGLAVFLALRLRAGSAARRRRGTARLRRIVNLWVVHPDGRGERLHFERSPVLVGAGAHARIPAAGAGRVSLSIAWNREEAWLEASAPVFVNGVARTRKTLRPNDRVTLAATRIIFRGITEIEDHDHAGSPARPDLMPLAAASSILLMAGGVLALARLMSLPPAPERRGVQPPPALSSLAPGPVQAPLDAVRPSAAEDAAGEPPGRVPEAPPPPQPPAPRPARRAAAPAPRRLPAPPPARPAPPLTAAARTAFAAPPDARPAPRSAVLQVAPGDEVPFVDADILLFHAHPDDESLDFAGLMSLASRCGLKTVIVMFTDGEGGLDQYPDRPATGPYPAGAMTGAALARVRVGEASRALEILGAAMYVRLGLPNHRYAASKDELDLRRVLESWGGEARMVAAVADLIRGFRPEVVVSSDSNERGYEHFEHKAAGYVVARALESLGGRDAGQGPGAGRDAPRGYLVSVDPFQRPLYDDLVRLDLMRTDPLSGLTFREVQMAALKEHATQADASLLGVELLPNFRYEQYHPVYWTLPQPPEALLAAR